MSTDLSDVHQVDVVVIGAGIAGVAAGAELAARYSVVILERERVPAHHASGRSASVLSETSGHLLVCRLAYLSRAFFENPPHGFTEHPLLSPRGLVWIGQVTDGPRLDELAARAARVAPTTRRLTPTEAAEMLPWITPPARAGGAVYEPDAQSIDTATVINGYLRLCHERGGRVATNTEVLDARLADDGRWVVRTSAGSWSARSVVNAAGAWVDEVAKRCGVAPIGTVSLRRTAAICPTEAAHPGWPLVMDVGGRFYFEPDPGGLLISPADETLVEPCDARPDEIDVALALERVAEATGLPLRSVRSAWAGLRTFAPDRVPVLGEDPAAPGWFWLAGQGGAGIKTAPAMAALLVAAIAGEPFPVEATDLGITKAALSPARFVAR